MLRRGTSAIASRAHAAKTTALVPLSVAGTQLAPQRGTLEFLAIWWWPSWAMVFHWQFLTFFPVVVMDWFKPSHTANKLPILHAFYEKRVDMKLRAAMDSVVTHWPDELDAASIDSAITRAF